MSELTETADQRRLNAGGVVRNIALVGKHILGNVTDQIVGLLAAVDASNVALDALSCDGAVGLGQLLL